MSRQNQAMNDPLVKNPKALLIVDDCSSDPKLLARPIMQKIFKNGRHAEMMFILGLQYCMDIKPNIRQNIDYIFLFREPNESSRKNLYANYAGIAGSYNDFCDLMDQLTGDYYCLVIDNRNQAMDMKECIYYYKAPLIGKLDFGCDEYKQWADARYNSSYKPTFD
jgi:hypothetical protein